MAKGQSVSSNKVERGDDVAVYKMFKGPAVVKRLLVAPKEHVFGPCSIYIKITDHYRNFTVYHRMVPAPTLGTTGLKHLKKATWGFLAVQGAKSPLRQCRKRV